MPIAQAAPTPEICTSYGAAARFTAIEAFHPLAAQGMRTIAGLVEQGSPIVVAWSSGKDSSVLVSLVLTTALALCVEGVPIPRILIVHTDTGVESPAVRQLADGEIERMRAFAAEHGLTMCVHPSRATCSDVGAIQAPRDGIAKNSHPS